MQELLENKSYYIPQLNGYSQHVLIGFPPFLLVYMSGEEVKVSLTYIGHFRVSYKPNTVLVINLLLNFHPKILTRLSNMRYVTSISTCIQSKKTKCIENLPLRSRVKQIYFIKIWLHLLVMYWSMLLDLIKWHSNSIHHTFFS